MELTEQNQIKRIEELLERFFDGSTSNEQEQELSLFFSGNAIPQHLISYKPLFAYFNTELEQELLCIDSESVELDMKQYDMAENESLSYRINLRRRLPSKTGALRRLLTSCVAALFLVFICVTSYNIISSNNTFDPYEGSFIIRDGVKITDLSQIRPELEATMNRVLYKEQRAEREFLQMEYDLSSKYLDFIRSFPEGPIREEVMMSFQ